jgi:UDP-N-acetyl-D-glucosamine dehydrogenase
MTISNSAGPTPTVGVLGLGYAGLPLARAFAAAGVPVLGFDTDAAKVDALNVGQNYIGHLPADTVRAMHAAGFSATSDLGRLGEPDAVLICVPTPLSPSRDPDLRFVAAAAHAVAARLRPSQLVVLESTTYPGTTREVVLPALESTGLRAGADFFLAYSPEREDPGHPRHTVTAVPKVVGGYDTQSRERACTLYARVAPRVVPVSTLEAAEACKVLENTYRAVNVALVNELKVLCDRLGVDVWEVVEAAATKPFGFQRFDPGPGLGGHCIPVDPFYLAWAARRVGLTARFVELAGEVNAAMPGWVVGKVVDALNDRGKPVKGSAVLLLGMAYKKDVDDPRESPGFEIMDLLVCKGATLRYHDPYIPRLPATRRWPHLNGESVELTEAVLGAQDCVVVVTDHSAYDWDWVVAHAPLLVDTRNATRTVPAHRERIVRA